MATAAGSEQGAVASVGSGHASAARPAAAAQHDSFDVGLVNPPYDGSSCPPLPPISPLLQSWLQAYSAGPLSEAELLQYQQWGYCVVRGVLSEADLAPAVAAVEGQVEQVASALFDAGLIRDKCAELDLFHRLTALERQYPSCSVLLHKLGVLDRGIAQLFEHHKLLAIARQVVGPGSDVAAHPNWSLRAKTPHQEQATVPWHQDAAYLEPDADNTLQMTAWIPFIDATVENGCMQAVRGGHRAGVVVPHLGCSGSTWYIEASQQEMPGALQLDVKANTVTLPVQRGDVLLLNNLIPHRSLANTSDVIRWSIDLRWQDADKPSGYAAKPTLRLTKRDDPHYKPRWAEWADMDRQQLVAEKAAADATKAVDSSKVEEQKDAFDTHIVGPWMDRWPLRHHNRHTERWLALKGMDQQARDAAMSRN